MAYLYMPGCLLCLPTCRTTGSVNNWFCVAVQFCDAVMCSVLQIASYLCPLLCCLLQHPLMHRLMMQAG